MADIFQVDSSVIADEDSDVRVVTAEGELDMATVIALRSELDAQVDGTGRKLLLDLSGLRFIDSAGITALYRANASFAHFAVVVSPGSQIAQTLAISGFDQVLPIFVEREEAARALG